MLTSDSTLDKSSSPCVRNCCLDGDDICLGCGRALEEITGWNAATAEEKQKILQRSNERMEIRRNKWSR